MKKKLISLFVIMIFLVSTLCVYASPVPSAAPEPTTPGAGGTSPPPAGTTTPPQQGTQPLTPSEQRRAYMAAEVEAKKAYDEELKKIQEDAGKGTITREKAIEQLKAAANTRDAAIKKLGEYYPAFKEEKPKLELKDYPEDQKAYDNYMSTLSDSDMEGAARFENAFNGLTVEQQRRVIDALRKGGYEAEYARATTEALNELSEARKTYGEDSPQFKEAEKKANDKIKEAGEEFGEGANEVTDKIRKEDTVIFKDAWSSIVGTAAGFSGYSSIVEDEQYLEFMDRSWNPVIDFLFNNLLGGGVEAWTSEICKVKVRRHGPASNILYTESGGRPQTSVFANGERSQLIHPNGTIEYFYKLSYYVNIPEIAGTTPLGQTFDVTRTQARGPPEGYFNVFVLDNDGVKHPLYIDLENPTLQLNLPIEDGAYALLTSMKVFYSKRMYTDIIIEFYKHKGNTSPTLDIHFVGKSVRYYSNHIVPAAEEVGGTITAGGAPQGFTASDGTQVGFNSDL